MPRSIRKIVALALVLCGSSLPAESAGHWLDVPFVAQQKDGCGSAVIAMVMQYWQQQRHADATPAADYNRIDNALQSKAARGI